jgi:flagellar biosynthesis protein FliQ
MRSDLALQLINDLLWNAILISAPLLGITLLVGLARERLQ